MFTSFTLACSIATNSFHKIFIVAVQCKFNSFICVHSIFDGNVQAFHAVIFPKIWNEREAMNEILRNLIISLRILCELVVLKLSISKRFHEKKLLNSQISPMIFPKLWKTNMQLWQEIPFETVAMLHFYWHHSTATLLEKWKIGCTLIRMNKKVPPPHVWINHNIKFSSNLYYYYFIFFIIDAYACESTDNDKFTFYTICE